MKICNGCKIEKPLSEFHKRSARPCGVSGKCKVCKSIDAAEYRQRNLDGVRAKSRDWHRMNKEKSGINARAWQKDNADRNAENRRAYRAENSDKLRLQWKNWRDENRETVRMHKARRRAALKLACPAWADKDAIKSIYAEAVNLHRQTGVEHHVDHIIPLQHQLVCGLHVEQNLRAIPKQENQRKYNNWSPDFGRVVGE